MTAVKPVDKSIKLNNLTLMTLEKLRESEALKPREIDYNEDPTAYRIAEATQWERENSALRFLLGVWLVRDVLEQNIKGDQE